ncbi:MAG: TonB-dependent receptor plug domain-containing protein, partial [Rikenellaceae bacterium]|nr:TonB-dependent receptor plug domain-containing protein [Rikenellaceae bacterium]
EINSPIPGARITVAGRDITTGEDGTFSIQAASSDEISFWAIGYYPITQLVNNRTEITVVMIPDDAYKYNNSYVLPFRIKENEDPLTSAVNIGKDNFTLGSMTIDRALTGQIAGLQVTRNSGMPGEDSYMNFRGIRSFVGSNAPLIVINGVPHLPDDNES